MRWMKGPEGRHWLIALGALALVALVGLGIARAQAGPPAGGPCARGEGLLTSEDRQLLGDRFMQRLSEKIGLGAEQAQEIRAVFKSQRDQTQGDIQKLCEARLGFRQLMNQQNADPAAVRVAADQIKTLQGSLLDRRVETYLTLRSKLTAEQWAKWQELRQQWGSRYRRHRPVS